MIERDLGILNITATDIQDELKGPNIVEEYREQMTKE